MKFKFLVTFFNIVIFFCFFTLFFLPAFILDFSFLKDFWRQSWYLIALFFLVIVGLDIIFFINYPVISKLEAEDWPGLAQVLETDIFSKKKVRVKKVNLLTDALLLLQDFPLILKLEKLIANEDKKLYPQVALGFASAGFAFSQHDFVLSVSEKTQKTNTSSYFWIKLFCLLSLTAQQKNAEGAELIQVVCKNSTDFLILAIMAYLAETLYAKKDFSTKSELLMCAASTKEKVLKKVSASRWKRTLDKTKTTMHGIVLSKILKEVDLWLYGANAS